MELSRAWLCSGTIMLAQVGSKPRSWLHSHSSRCLLIAHVTPPVKLMPENRSRLCMRVTFPQEFIAIWQDSRSVDGSLLRDHHTEALN